MIEVIIVGGGRVGFRLTQLLKQRVDYHITVIDSNEDTIEKIEKEFDDVNVVKGDATNKKNLIAAGIETADILVAATGTDEVNLLISTLAQNYNLDKIIARTANPSHIKMFKKLGLNEVVSPELTACSDIEKLIIRPNVAEIAIYGKGECELIDVTVKAKKVIGKRIGDISPKKDFIVVMCNKNDEILIAQNDIVLEKNDIVTVLVKRAAVKKTRKYFTKNSILPSL